jgi:hypothetical protein
LTACPPSSFFDSRLVREWLFERTKSHFSPIKGITLSLSRRLLPEPALDQLFAGEASLHSDSHTPIRTRRTPLERAKTRDPSNLNFEGLQRKESFIPNIVKAVDEKPF